MPLYYVEKTNRHGQQELIRVDAERDGLAIGIIIASDVSEDDCGISWSNRLENLSKGSKQKDRPNTKYEFTLQPYIEKLSLPQCECHERDSSYVCDYCRSQGYRGHMESAER